jgi:hypothetical protein
MQEYVAVTADSKPQAPPPKRPSPWIHLHNYPIQHERDWSPMAAKRWYEVTWSASIPQRGCDCTDHWAAYVAKNPPPFDDPKSNFAWGVEAHNYVSREHAGHPTISVAQAYGIFRRVGTYSSAKPLDKPAVDVVIPFYGGDRHFLNECVTAIQQQRHVNPIIHAVADGCEFPEGVSRSIHRYSTAGGQGPYRIANSVVCHGHCESSYLAIQDVDDISFPDRLWRQIAAMREFGYEMAGGSMEQRPADGYNRDRHLRLPILYPWNVYPSAPNGHLINGTRTLTVDLFRRVNGFMDLMCSADFEFDNRTSMIAMPNCVPAFGSRDIDAIRRLHDASLTNGPGYDMGTPARTECNDRVMDALTAMEASPTVAAARSLGGLQDALPLQQL